MDMAFKEDLALKGPGTIQRRIMLHTVPTEARTGIYDGHEKPGDCCMYSFGRSQRSRYGYVL